MCIRRDRCWIFTIRTARSMRPIAERTATGRSLRRNCRIKAAGSKDGTGLYFLSETITSPTLARQWKALHAAYPKATLVQYDPAIAGTWLAKGLNVQYDLSGADVIVSLDADFLSSAAYPGFHKLVRDYASASENARKRDEPAVRGGELDYHDGDEGRTSADAARERDSGVCGGACEGGGCCGRGCSGLCVDRRAAEVPCCAGQGFEGERGQERCDPGTVSGRVGCRRWHWPSTRRWAMSARR